MNILTANEIKKYGVAIIEKQMMQGPVHVFKHNRPLFVVITETDYQRAFVQSNKSAGLFSMLQKSEVGKRAKEDIDLQLQRDREEWN